MHNVILLHVCHTETLVNMRWRKFHDFNNYKHGGAFSLVVVISTLRVTINTVVYSSTFRRIVYRLRLTWCLSG